MGMIVNFLKVKESALNAFIENSELLEERIFGDTIEEDPDYLDIDKTWDGIIFLLTGKGLNTVGNKEPFLKAIFSGVLLDKEQDLGYGPAHYLLPNQVSELSKELSKIGINDLKEKFYPTQMLEKNIYPGIWNEDDFDYLSSHFMALKPFYKNAAENNLAVISIMS